MTEPTSGFTPLAPSTGQPPRLAMQRLWLTGRILPAGARLSVEHTFQSDEPKPLEAIYCFPLPRDAALRRFRIRGDGWETESELRPTAEAEAAYEIGIRQGSLSVLARQHGDGVVNLALGNLRPREMVTVHLEILAGVELHDDSFRFRFPFTLAPTYHREAKALLVAPGEGEMQLPRAEFGDVMLPHFRQDASALHSVGFELTAQGLIGSPSHAVSIAPAEEGQSRVSLAVARDVPDRDLVLDVRYQPAVQVLSGGGHFAAIVPSTAFGVNRETARRVAILLDRSGSMGGEPIAQARHAIEACLGALALDDSFGLIAFDYEAESFRPQLCPATQENRRDAGRFLAGVGARGGTELALGITEAARLFDSGGGDILVLTDGQVSATEDILSVARGAGVRLHCLGIGSASQDRFLSLLARETGGVSRFVTPGERVDLAAVELFASVGRPVASDLTVEGPVAPAPPSFVFGGTPVLLFGEVGSPIELRWDGGGHLAIPIPGEQPGIGDTVRLLQGSRLITDMEARSTTDARRANRIAAALVELGREYGLANREMSLVAVMKRAGDRPGEFPETRVVPVGMPRGTEFSAYFGPPTVSSGAICCAMAAPPCPPPAAAARRSFSLFSRRPKPTEEDKLMALAARIEPDGGMPGRNDRARVAATIEALRELVAHSAFRVHVARLVAFLEKANLTEKQREEVEGLLGQTAVQ